MASPYTYEVALSFAGEQRDYVRAVNEALKALDVKTFYDDDHAVDLWGKNHTEELPRIYAEDSHLVLMFISEHYVDKRWPRHERRAILTEMTQRGTPYLLPVRFDDSTVPGLDSGWHYLKAEEFDPERVAEAAYAQLVSLGVRQPRSRLAQAPGVSFGVETLSASDGVGSVASALDGVGLAEVLSRQASRRPEDIRAALDFGTSQPVEVPVEQIAVEVEQGRNVFSGAQRVVMQAAGLAHLKGKSAGMRFFGAGGRLSGSFTGKVNHAGMGRLGSALEISFDDGLDVIVCCPLTEGSNGSITTRLHLDGLSPEGIRRCVGTLLQLHEAETAEITLDGQSLGKVGGFSSPEDSKYLMGLRTLFEAADDLAVIQRQTGVYFPMPEEIEGYERLWIRTIRLMLDGHAAPVPRKVYRGVARSDLDPATMLDEGTLAIMMPGNEVTVAGHPIPVDPFIIYHPHAVFVGVEDSWRDVTRRVDHPREFEVRPADETAFVAYFPDRLDAGAQASTPWGIAGVDDPPITRLVRGSA
ncbi:TIR domain-containing protein [Luteococcus japonicus]|nr:TIR domain-containing protein [Luteococcus japonicus]